MRKKTTSSLSCYLQRVQVLTIARATCVSIGSIMFILCVSLYASSSSYTVSSFTPPATSLYSVSVLQQHQQQQQQQQPPTPPPAAAALTRQRRTVTIQSQDNSNNDYTNNDDDNHKLDSIILSKIQSQPNLKSNLLYTYNITTHKPSMGLTIEESLVDGINNEKFIFISKIVKDGIASKCGLEVGDLIVGVSGTFDDVEDVFGQSLERVRKLIAGRPQSSNLILKIVRNTSILQQHESALVDLCILPEGDIFSGGRDKAIETCIETMYKASYDYLDGDDGSNSDRCNDEDLECMLETLSDLWNDDQTNDTTTMWKKEEDDDNGADQEPKKPAPWSSRSSPSGTWVRVNGTMVNIDE